jgi:DNA-binding winged helix-turn-helix (wHTH) protein
MSYPWSAGTQGLQVEDLLIDLRGRRLISPEGSVELQQRVFDLLLLLVSTPSNVLTRAEIFDSIWAGLVVDDSNLSQSIWLLRNALGDKRRSWIRTVARQGYAFDPPGPVTYLDTLPASTVAAVGQLVQDPFVPREMPSPVQNTVSPTDADAGVARRAPETDVVNAEAQVARGAVSAGARSISRPRTRVALLGLAAIVIIACVTWWVLPKRSTDTLFVSLTTVKANSSADLPWASELLSQWTAWKLRQLSAVRVLSGEDIAAGKGFRNPQIVLISAVLSTDAKQVTLRARIERPGADRIVERTVLLDQAPAAIDELSNELLKTFLPAQKGRWPALEVSAEGARKYIPIAEAFDQGHWSFVQAHAPSLLAQEPRFGLLYLQLAQAQSELGQTLPAIRHMELAVSLLSPLPPEAEAMLRASELAVDPRRAVEAVQAYEALLAVYPGDPAPHLQYADLLIDIGRYSRALSELNGNEVSASRTLLDRYEREISLARAYSGLGDLESARKHARAAREMSDAVAPRMLSQAANAHLIEAGIVSQADPAAGAEAYISAAKLLREVGLPLRGSYAEGMAALQTPPLGDHQQAAKDALEKVRVAGALRLQLLIEMALFNYSRDSASKTEWAQRTLRTAQLTGKVDVQGQVEAYLAMIDLDALRPDAARARAIQMDALELEGLAGRRISVMLSDIYLQLGNLREAREATKDLAKGTTADSAPGTPAPSFLSCYSLLPVLYLGDADRFRPALAECNATVGATIYQSQARSSLALASTLVDDTRAARLQYNEALQAIDKQAAYFNPEEDASSRLLLAMVGLRLRDRDGVARLVQPLNSNPGMRVPIPLQRAALAVLNAELQAVHGNWEASRRYAAEARKQLPESMVELRQRLDLLDIADAQRQADGAQASELARKAYSDAWRRNDVRMQQLISSLVPADALMLTQEQKVALGAGRALLPGATMKWLEKHPRPSAAASGAYAARTRADQPDAAVAPAGR